MLKIDKAFVDDVASGAEGAGVIHAIVRLARTLQLDTVAEGVEDADQVRRLAELGCDQIQGFCFSQALPPAELEQLLQQHRQFDPRPRPAARVPVPATARATPPAEPATPNESHVSSVPRLIRVTRTVRRAAPSPGASWPTTSKDLRHWRSRDRLWYIVHGVRARSEGDDLPP